MDLASWGPTLVAIITAVYIAGGYGRDLRSNTKRIDAHDVDIKDLGTRMTAAEAWRDGYNAGRAK